MVRIVQERIGHIGQIHQPAGGFTPLPILASVALTSTLTPADLVHHMYGRGPLSVWTRSNSWGWTKSTNYGLQAPERHTMWT